MFIVACYGSFDKKLIWFELSKTCLFHVIQQEKKSFKDTLLIKSKNLDKLGNHVSSSSYYKKYNYSF